MNSIYATFSDPSQAEKAGGALLDHGVKNENLSIILPESYRKDDQPSTHDANKQTEQGITTTTGADAGSGAAKGAGWGLAVGVLAALAAIFVPGVGLVVGSGALATAIGGAAGATAGGAIAGGVTGYLKDQGVPENELHRYSDTISSGGAILTVSPTTDMDVVTIEEIIRKYDGVINSYPYREAYSRSA